MHVYGKGYPEKDIRIYIPVGPGGTMDFMIRGAAPFLEKSLGVRIFMENTSGSSGGIAYNRVYRMKPDGYNLVVFGLPTLLLTSLNQQVDFKPEEFTPIYAWESDQQILFTHSLLRLSNCRSSIHLSLSEAPPGEMGPFTGIGRCGLRLFLRALCMALEHPF
jgi:tripartite-type tricarboxylate transporter receptor subunit TctC